VVIYVLGCFAASRKPKVRPQSEQIRQPINKFFRTHFARPLLSVGKTNRHLLDDNNFLTRHPEKTFHKEGVAA
jgi:hypothetical protein